MGDAETRVILLVEGDPSIALRVRERLEQLGYKVTTSVTGEAAVEHCSNRAGIDLILIDLELGAGMDGAQAAKTILRTLEVPVIFLFGHAEPRIAARTESLPSYGFIPRDSDFTVLEASIQCALRLFDENQRLRRTANGQGSPRSSRTSVGRRRGGEPGIPEEYLLRSLLDTSSDLIYFKDMDGRFIRNSRGHAEFLGLADSSEMLGKTDFDFFEANIARQTQADEQDIIRTGQALRKEERLSTLGGLEAWVLIEKMPLKDMSGNTIGTFGISRDISGIKLAELATLQAKEALERTNGRMKVLADNLPGLLAFVDADSLNYEYVNEAYMKSFGVPEDRIVGSHVRALIGEENFRFASPFIEDVRSGKPTSYENLFDFVDGRRWSKVNYVPIFGKRGRVESILELSYDITDHKRTEELITGFLREKELILREVHHRVKNYLATISGLIALQTSRAVQPETQGILRELQSQVQGMGFLYERLYQSSGDSPPPAGEYLPDLIDRIVGSFPNCADVSVEKDIESLSLDRAKLQPFGMIVNELLTNTMKHAFPGGAKGRIRVSLSAVGDRARLVVADDGAGIPAGVDFENSSGFGMMLVGMLAKQLRGDIEIDRGHGSKIVLEFAL